MLIRSQNKYRLIDFDSLPAIEIMEIEGDVRVICSDTYDIVIHCESEEEQKKAIALINSSSKKSSGWIPVSERLPDPDKYILVSFENFSLPIVGRYTVDDDDSGTFRVGDEDESFVEHDLYVNAWMELPKCYKGE